MVLIRKILSLIVFVSILQSIFVSHCVELPKENLISTKEAQESIGDDQLQIENNIIPVIFGIASTNLTKDEKKLFSQYKVKGFILYKRNIESVAQVRRLIKDLRALYDYPVLVVIDQEGGIVTNIEAKISKYQFPSQTELGSNYFSNYASTMHNTRQNYQNISDLLNKLGFDSGLSPVCDLKSTKKTSYIGSRSFGSNVTQVIDLSREAIKTMLENSIIPVLKHAPGHGGTELDSHRFFPVIKDKIEYLESNDFKIFQTLIEEFKNSDMMLMTTHTIYQALDPELPVTISKNAISYIRNKMNFKNIILTDAIDMFSLHDPELIQNLEKKIFELGTKYYLVDINSNKNINYFSLLGNKKIASEIELFEEKKKFNASLLEVAHKSLKSGCDIVLHCSGKIKEMRYILENFYS